MKDKVKRNRMINKELILSTIGGFEQLGLIGKSPEMKNLAPRTGLELNNSLRASSQISYSP